MKKVTFKALKYQSPQLLVEAYVSRHLLVRVSNAIGFVNVSGRMIKVEGRDIIYVPAHSKCWVSLRPINKDREIEVERFTYSEEVLRAIVDNYYFFDCGIRNDQEKQFDTGDYFDSSIEYRLSDVSSCIVHSISVFALVSFLNSCSEFDKANILSSMKIINKVTNCITSDVEYPWTLDNISLALGINKRNLLTELNSVNITFSQLLNNIRLKKSVSLIMSGMSIKQAAIKSGFGCPNYFSRVFKRRYGVQPSRLIKSSGFVDTDGLDFIKAKL
ncbi:hypothetical protein VHTUMSATKI_50380 [Vibrio harveyi]|uniref:helix-turn-helix transcriptional regulator n=1 Tax=Vibrio harveyi TaxID=669 RepID=UPI0036F3533C